MAGDTFQDDWHEEVPKTWGKWAFLRRSNSKAGVNTYEFSHTEEPEFCDWRFSIESSSADKMELRGSLYIFDKAPRGDDYRRGELSLDMKIEAEWTSLEEAFTRLDAKFQEVLAHVRDMRAITREPAKD